MGQTTILIMILTIVSKIFGFVRESVMAAYIGAGELKSIYTTSTTLPSIFTSVIAIGIVTGYIPIYNKIIKDLGEDEVNKFTSNLINILIIIGTVILVIVCIFASSISKILSPDLSGESLELATNYTRVIMFSVYFLFYGSVIRGYLNIKGNFVEPALTGIFLNIIIIISVILTGKYNNPYILIFGVLLAYILQNFRYPIIAKKLGFKYRFIVDFSDKYIRSLFILVVPIILSTATNEISLIVDNSMASAYFGKSSISKIFYAKTMLNFILSVITLTITTVTFPEIAKLGQNGHYTEMSKQLKKTVVISMIFVIPSTLGMMALSNPIIKLAFERNAFTALDTEIVSSLLVSYGPYIVFMSLIKIYSNGFYSLENSRTPLRVIVIQQILNVILNIKLSKVFGLNGLAFATTISTFLASLILVIIFNKKYKTKHNVRNIGSIIKIIIISLIMFCIARLLYFVLVQKFNYVISLFLTALFSSTIYFVMIHLMNIPEFNAVVLEIKEKF